MSNGLISAHGSAKGVVRLVPLAVLLFLIGCAGGRSSPTIITPTPSITSLTPDKGVVGISVTISGANFGSSRGSSTVTFNGTPASTISWSSTSIIARVPTGASTGNVVVIVGQNASNGIAFTVETVAAGTIASADFGFQCSFNLKACPNGQWPTSIAQPNLLRLWDCGTGTLGQGCRWSDIEFSAPGVYTWTTLDTWLDTIYAQTLADPWATPPAVVYTFGFVSCQEIAACRNDAEACSIKGCTSVPDDFTTAGSPSFNNFVTALVNHCNRNNRCVKDLIKYYEMWNEPNNPNFWTGTELQVYQMVAPAIGIIRSVVNGQNDAQTATIMTIASTAEPSYTATWLGYESQYGVGSDVVVWHQYLNDQTVEVAPEDPALESTLSNLIQDAVNVGKPWQITETSWQAYTPPYSCDTSIFSTSDCIGQMVRWQLIVLSRGAQSLDWYSWNVNIGSQPSYAGPWASMMADLVGGKFSDGPCSTSDGVTWTCPFTEADGVTSALWVWTTDEAGSTFTVPPGFNNSLDLSGTSAAVNPGQLIDISVMPIMLTQ
ncbi:MAG: IPT/TIG domain-containing protein [Candidatus Sulfotelmatobacter sp.]